PEPQANRRARIAEARRCTDRDLEDAADRHGLCCLLRSPRHEDRCTPRAAALRPAPSSPAATRRGVDQDWPGTCLALRPDTTRVLHGATPAAEREPAHRLPAHPAGDRGGIWCTS